MSHTLAYRYAAAVLHLALIAGIVASSGVSSGALVMVPLLVPLPGILRGQAYTCAWASMLLSFYVGGYLSAAYAHPQQKWTAVGMAAVAALEFVSLVLYVRLLRRAGSPAQTAASGAAAP